MEAGQSVNKLAWMFVETLWSWLPAAPLQLAAWTHVAILSWILVASHSWMHVEIQLLKMEASALLQALPRMNSTSVSMCAATH